jgi:anti-sigma factor RsiW
MEMIDNDPHSEIPEPESDDLAPVDQRTERLVSYLDGELTSEQTEEIEAALHHDPALRKEAESLKQAWDLLDFLPRPEPSPDFTNKTVSQIVSVKSPSGITSKLTSSTPIPSSESGTSVQQIRSAISHPQSSKDSVYLQWAIAILVFGLLGWMLEVPIRNKMAPVSQTENDAQILSDMRILDNLKYYRHIEDLAFLQALDQPEFFGEAPFARE